MRSNSRPTASTLKQSLPSGSLAVLNRAWTAVPRHLRRHPLMLAAYARHLMQQNQMDEAERVLRDALDGVLG